VPTVRTWQPGEGTGREQALAPSAHPSSSPSSCSTCYRGTGREKLKALKSNKKILAVPSCVYGFVVVDAARHLLRTLQAHSAWQRTKTPGTALGICWGRPRARLVPRCRTGTRLLRARGSCFCLRGSQSRLPQSTQQVLKRVQRFLCGASTRCQHYKWGN